MHHRRYLHTGSTNKRKNIYKCKQAQYSSLCLITPKPPASLFFCRLSEAITRKGEGVFSDRRDFLNKRPGMRSMFREIHLKFKEEEKFAASSEHLNEKGKFMYQSKLDLRRHSHLGSLDGMKGHWDRMLSCEPGTEHVQYLASIVHDTQQHLELVYAQNLQMLSLLQQEKNGPKTSSESAKVQSTAGPVRSMKGTQVAKTIRKFAERLILEQPLTIRESGRVLLKTISSSSILWPESSYAETVRTIIERYSATMFTNVPT